MEELTKKQKIFVKEYVKSENGTQSALKAYDTKSENVAGALASENLRKPNIATAIEEVRKSLAERIPDELLEKVHLEGLVAGKMVGETLEPDYAVRHKYLDSGYKLKGSYAPDKAINLNIQTDITNPKARELAEEYEEKLKRNL